MQLFHYIILSFFEYYCSVSGTSVSGKTATERDEDLENTIGNLLIANYQVMRLEQRLQGKVSIINEKHSSFTFKRSGEWYKVYVGVERQPKGKEEFESEQKEKDPNPVIVASGAAWSTPSICGTPFHIHASTSRDDTLIIQ